MTHPIHDPDAPGIGAPSGVAYSCIRGTDPKRLALIMRDYVIITDAQFGMSQVVTAKLLRAGGGIIGTATGANVWEATGKARDLAEADLDMRAAREEAGGWWQGAEVVR